tara:strand:+ start:332 stop:541 length:210 start_codon:yes stop_codon:yes gene_type:complete
MTALINYIYGYTNGRKDKTRELPMNIPDCMGNLDEFNGYFHGYGLHKYQPPTKDQKIVRNNIAKFNFMT